MSDDFPGENAAKQDVSAFLTPRTAHDATSPPSSIEYLRGRASASFFLQKRAVFQKSMRPSFVASTIMEYTHPGQT